ncbi:hypothetical protein N8818_00030 [Candidatus Pelagibacter sp.]|jgi:alginate O-acetyltransferase complex protein AlgI|nr:hypothetical protein [Candidatus Pelagibacter sp.]
MLFHSTTFLIFFVIVFLLYLKSNHFFQNKILLVASYIFYGAWEWKYLGLLLTSTITDYFCALFIDKSEKKNKKYFVYISIFVNLSLLGVFKYYDFFALEFSNLVNVFGLEINPTFLNIVLPIGISFYTFQTISYTVDVYRGKLEPCKNFFDFALYVSFFPQLVAGPIERGIRFLPQVLNKRDLNFKNFKKGLYCVFWGLFMKTVIADNMADMVDPIYDINSTNQNGALVFIATYAFAIQIYCDFSGYSLIAIGLAKMMGFELMENFRRPYFSKNISDFWRRWHISLSSWFRDYMFSPLYIYFQNSKIFRGKSIQFRHLVFFMVVLFLTEFLLGLWHGAGWNYAFFGVYHAILIGGYYFIKKYWDKIENNLQIFITFNLACIGWLVFRSEGLTHSYDLFKLIITNWTIDELTINYIVKFLILFSGLFVHEIIEEIKNKRYAISYLPKILQYSLYTLIVVSMIMFGQFGVKKFIYFQF